MKTFEVLFEIYGKKLKTTISAKSKDDAKTKIKDKIIFHKISENENIDFLKNIFGIK